jgi:hypothetical protein
MAFLLLDESVQQQYIEVPASAWAVGLCMSLMLLGSR